MNETEDAFIFFHIFLLFFSHFPSLTSRSLRFSAHKNPWNRVVSLPILSSFRCNWNMSWASRILFPIRWVIFSNLSYFCFSLPPLLRSVIHHWPSSFLFNALFLSLQNGMHWCDHRSSVSQLKSRFPAIDFSSLSSEDDNQWSPDRESKQVSFFMKQSSRHTLFPYSFSPSLQSVLIRCEQLLQDLFSRDEETVAVVSHSAFLLTMFNTLFDYSLTSKHESLRQWFHPGEMRHVCIGRKQQ